jgi:hypothetical protein
MARCPFAEWKVISGGGGSGAYKGGPFRVVHHTTEGSSAQGAFDAFAKNRDDPHFTVDATTIWQHVDTQAASSSLRNAPGGVETNRRSAVQIEMVGFAGQPKNRQTLANVARLCRWIEQTHGVPRVWPGGPPKPPRNGDDPGGHVRDATLWVTAGGHYGHSQVPENVHWDPAYTAEEASYVLAADFDAQGAPTTRNLPTFGGAASAAGAALAGRLIATIGGEGFVSTILEDVDGRVHFYADADIDADGANGQNGAPAAYKVDDSGTEALANGGMKRVGGKVVCQQAWARGVAILDTDNQPKVFPGGVIASTTWYRDPAKATSDPAAYVDAETIAYVVVPPIVVQATRGIVRGCRARVTFGGKSVDCVVADLGPAGKVGELSIAAARAVGIPESPRNGGVSDASVLYELWPGVAAPGFTLQAA